MATMEADQLANAKEYMLQGYEKYKDIICQIHTLEASFNDVYNSWRPSPLDYDNRRDLIRIFNAVAKEIYGNRADCPVVEEFGSFTMDMFNAKSDLDLSINFSNEKVQDQRATKIRTLRMFAKKFYSLQHRGCVKNVFAILTARVPVLKVTDCGTEIECDVSVGNMDGIEKSHIIFLISAIDERFRKLCCLMKAWAKAHDINSSKDGTLNSLSLISLAALHLQTRDPPILPPFSAIFKDGINPAAVKRVVPRYLNYGEGNKESLADLFVSLLIMLESAKNLWSRGIWASVFEGAWISKKKSKGKINVEDFTDRSQNTARAVMIKNIDNIYSVIGFSLQQIRSFAEGEIDVDMLKTRLFGPEENTGGIQGIPYAAMLSFLGNCTQKRKCKTKMLTGSEEKKPVESSVRPISKKKMINKNNDNYNTTAVSGTLRPTPSQVSTSQESVGGTQSHPVVVSPQKKRKRQMEEQQGSEKEKPVDCSLPPNKKKRKKKNKKKNKNNINTAAVAGVAPPTRSLLSMSRESIGGTQSHPVANSQKKREPQRKQKGSEKQEPVGSFLPSTSITTSRFPPTSLVDRSRETVVGTHSRPHYHNHSDHYPSGFRPDVVRVEQWRYNLSNNFDGKHNHQLPGANFSTHRPDMVHVESGRYNSPKNAGWTWNPPLPNTHRSVVLRQEPIHVEPWRPELLQSNVQPWRHNNPTYPPSAPNPQNPPPYNPPFSPPMQGSYGHFPPSSVPTSYRRGFHTPEPDYRHFWAPSPYHRPLNVTHVETIDHQYQGGTNNVWRRVYQ